MENLAAFIQRDMERRGMSLREYAKFIGSSHPTVARYLNEPDRVPQWEFLVTLSRATHTDIGTLARLAAPDLTIVTSDVPSPELVLQRLTQLPIEFRRTILDMIEAYLAQKNRAKNG